MVAPLENLPPIWWYLQYRTLEILEIPSLSLCFSITISLNSAELRALEVPITCGSGSKLDKELVPWDGLLLTSTRHLLTFVGFLKWGYPNSWMVHMDDLGIAPARKPPFNPPSPGRGHRQSRRQSASHWARRHPEPAIGRWFEGKTMGFSQIGGVPVNFPCEFPPFLTHFGRLDGGWTPS